MNLSLKLHSAAKCAAISAVALLSTNGAFAQDYRSHAATPMTGGTFMFFLLVVAAVYVYTALAVQTIAEKTNTENPWLAWIPIANIILLLNIAKKPVWWIVLFLIPLVNIIIVIMVWMAVAEARGKPGWVGVLLIVPVLGALMPGYLAWAD